MKKHRLDRMATTDELRAHKCPPIVGTYGWSVCGEFCHRAYLVPGFLHPEVDACPICLKKAQR